MSQTRTALASLTVAARRLGESRDLFKASDLTKAVAAMNLQAFEPKPQQAILEEVRRNLIAAARGPGGVAAAKSRDLKQAPWLLWAGPKPLIELNGLLAAIYNQAPTSGLMRSRLIEAWISACDPALTGVEDCGRKIGQWMRESDDLRLEFWRQAQARFAFFDPLSGPANVAQEVLNHRESVAAILKAAGLDETRASTGYARLVQKNLLADFSLVEPRGEAVLARAQMFLEVGTKLRFPEPAEAGRVANAFLAPWRLGVRQTPGESLRKDVQAFLLRHLGDPRSRPQSWAFVDKDAVGLMRGWLARANLEAFFDVVADNADENFRFRRAFWTACLWKAQRTNVYNDVWLALGSQVRAQADGIKELHGNFARLKGAQGVQSVFLMRIHDIVFAEWSHSGSVRAWPENAVGAPRLDHPEYERSDLMRKGLAFPPNPFLNAGGAPDGDGLRHFNSTTGYWQGSVVKLLRDRCGVGLEPKDYMPK